MTDQNVKQLASDAYDGNLSSADMDMLESVVYKCVKRTHDVGIKYRAGVITEVEAGTRIYDIWQDYMRDAELQEKLEAHSGVWYAARKTIAEIQSYLCDTADILPFIDCARRVARKRGSNASSDIRWLPGEVAVYSGGYYLPDAYLLKFTPDGNPLHVLRMRDIRADSVVEAKIEDVKIYSEESSNGNKE